MKAILSQEEWEEYQQLKEEKEVQKTDFLTGRKILLHQVAKPNIIKYLNNNFLYRSNGMEHWADGTVNTTHEEINGLIMDVANYVFERATGEELKES